MFSGVLTLFTGDSIKVSSDFLTGVTKDAQIFFIGDFTVSGSCTGVSEKLLKFFLADKFVGSGCLSPLKVTECLTCSLDSSGGYD